MGRMDALREIYRLGKGIAWLFYDYKKHIS